MSHPNRIYNGDFAQDLDGWTISGSAAHVANQGNKELGAVHLTAGDDSIARDFTIGIGREYMLQVAARLHSGAATSLNVTITNSDGDTIYTNTPSVSSATWSNIIDERIGLPWGTHTLTIALPSYVVGTIQVDDISIAFTPKTRAELAADVHERLDVLATDAGLSTAASGTDTEGDYTDAVDAGLRKTGALDPAGRTDVRYLGVDMLDGCLEEIELAMLHRLHRYYSTKTDYAIGPRQEHVSQVKDAIEQLIGIAVGGRSASAGRAVKTRRLIHRGHQ